MVKYVCKKCHAEFDNKGAYDKHKLRITDCRYDIIKRKVKKHKCSHCKKVFSRKDSLARHLKICQVKINIQNIKNNNGNQIIGNNNKNNNNNNNNTNIFVNNNIQLPIPVHFSHLDELTTDDEISIFSSKENPMIMYFIYTHLNPDKPKFHNIGYIDKHSGTGYICNGKKFVQQSISHILRTVFENRLKDLEQLHNELQGYFSKKVNDCIREKLQNMNELLWGNPKNPKQSEKNLQNLKKMNANLKNLLYVHRDLFQKAYERMNKLNGDDDKDDIPETDPTTYNGLFENDNIKKSLYKDRETHRHKNNLKRDIAKNLLQKFDNINKNEFNLLNTMINQTTDVNVLNIINRILCKSYCIGSEINCKIIQEQIQTETQIDKLLFD